jgi:hypothetical protein
MKPSLKIAVAWRNVEHAQGSNYLTRTRGRERSGQQEHGNHVARAAILCILSLSSYTVHELDLGRDPFSRLMSHEDSPTMCLIRRLFTGNRGRAPLPTMFQIFHRKHPGKSDQSVRKGRTKLFGWRRTMLALHEEHQNNLLEIDATRGR